MHRLQTPQSPTLKQRLSRIVLTLFALSLTASPAQASTPAEPMSQPRLPLAVSRTLPPIELPTSPKTPADSALALEPSSFALPSKASLTPKAPTRQMPERANAATEPLRISADGQVSASYLVGQARSTTDRSRNAAPGLATDALINATADLAPLAACTPVEKTGTLSVSPKTFPLSTPTQVTITAKGANGAVLPNHDLVVAQEYGEPVTITTNGSGVATVQLSTPWSDPFKVSDELGEVQSTFVFPLGQGEGGLEVIARDRCGRPLPGEIWSTQPGTLGSQATAQIDGIAGFAWAQRSIFVDAFGHDADEVPHYLNTTARLSPGKVTTLVLTGERLSPTSFVGMLDNTSFWSGIVLMPSNRKGDGPAYLADSAETSIVSPGTYASLWMSNLGIMQNESLSVKGGTVMGAFRSRDLGYITPKATLNGQPLEVRYVDLKRGSFWVGFEASQPITAGKGSVTGITVLDPLGAQASFGRDNPLSITVKGGSTATFAAELSQGEAKLLVEPTYDRGGSLPFAWQQRSKDGWSLEFVDGTRGEATLVDPLTDEIYDQTEFARFSAFFLGLDAPANLLLTLQRPANAFSSVDELSATLSRNVYAIQTSPEVVRPGKSTTVTVTLTKNGKPLPGQVINFPNPDTQKTTQLKTNSKGTVTAKVNPKTATTYEFWWPSRFGYMSAYAYGLPEGWGLVEATATQEDGLPMDFFSFYGLEGTSGAFYGQGDSPKAMLPAGDQSLVLVGANGTLDESGWSTTPYLLTKSVTVTADTTTPVAFSAEGSVSLGLGSSAAPDELFRTYVTPAGFDRPASVMPIYYTNPLRLTPGSYDVAPVVIKYDATGWPEREILFPTRRTEGNETLFFDTALATTELRTTGVDRYGRPAALSAVLVDQGAGLERLALADEVRLAPGSYQITEAYLDFVSGRTLTEFIFTGALPIQVTNQPLIDLQFGGQLQGSLTAEQPSYMRGQTVNLTASLVEQQGLNLVGVLSGRLGSSFSFYPTSVQVKGPSRVSNLPVGGDGSASLVTSTKLKAGQYTFTLAQDLRSYFALPSIQTTVTLN